MEKIFLKLRCAGIKRIIFIPTEVVDIKLICSELKLYLYNIIRKRDDVFCGYYYTLKEFYKFWDKTYYTKNVYRIENNNLCFVLQVDEGVHE